MHIFEEIMTQVVGISILILELMGVIVILASAIRGFYQYAKRVPNMKLTLAKGLAVGLEFKMGSEILRTVIVRDLSEIVVVAGVIGLRAALNFLIHWEIHEEMEEL
ncbi:MAG: DUF1622 domain-containing protein [Eubacteriales bacterium]|nr:DUF1622 domain-containing protein [Eubacteriales bacterium]